MLTSVNNFSNSKDENQTPSTSFDFTSLQELFQKGQQYSPQAYAQLLDEAMWWLVEYRDCLGADFPITENYWRLRELRDAFCRMQ